MNDYSSLDILIVDFFKNKHICQIKYPIVRICQIFGRVFRYLSVLFLIHVAMLKLQIFEID